MSEGRRIVTVDRPRGNGCLWGCLGALLLVSLPFIVSWGYGAWSLWQAPDENPTIRAAMELVRHDGLAQRVMGRPITVAGVQGKIIHFAFGSGSRSSYLLNLQGPRGNGYLDVTSHVERAQIKIDTMKLTGPDDQEYDLLHHAPLPSGGGDTTPI